MTNIFYKGFDKDLRCRDYQFEVGKEYEIQGDLEICNNGFHFCENLKDVLEYYNIVGNRFCEIKALGQIISLNNKSCSNKIKIIKELSIEEIIELLGYKNNNLGIDNLGYNNTGNSNTGNWNTGNSNTGNWNTGNSNTGYNNTGNRNTGDWNTGNWNTGYNNTGNSNTGDWNTGDWNTGNSNTGDWNTINYETGSFNSKQSKFINIFNKKCERKIWENAIKPDFLFNIKPNIWISIDTMSLEEIKDVEKKLPYLKNQGGYLKNISMQEAWKIAFETASKRDIKLLKSLPNYSYKVFKEISGIEDERLK